MEDAPKEFTQNQRVRHSYQCPACGRFYAEFSQARDCCASPQNIRSLYRCVLCQKQYATRQGAFNCHPKWRKRTKNDENNNQSE